MHQRSEIEKKKKLNSKLTIPDYLFEQKKKRALQKLVKMMNK